jgi:GNAT superfamily N-acetyltransferase
MIARLPSDEIVEITTISERPHLEEAVIDVGAWPAFMRYNRVSEAYFRQAVRVFAETCLVATGQDGVVVADAQAVQFAFGAHGRNALPSGGWEQVVIWAFADADRKIAPDAACALNISVAATHQRQGLAGLMLKALRDQTRDLGLVDLVAPVRPTWKAREPRTAMAEYVSRIREDNLPYDPWLRTHVRAGGEIIGIAPASWVVAGSLAEWREWTGLPFDIDGEVDVPGALVPVHCDVPGGYAVYVESNVWIRHALGSATSEVA